MLADNLGKAEGVAISGPKTLVLRFPPGYNHEREYCQESTRLTRIQAAIRSISGQEWNIRLEAGAGESAVPKALSPEPPPSSYRRQRTDASQEPLVRRALDQLGAQIVHVDEGFSAARVETLEPETANSEEIEAS